MDGELVPSQKNGDGYVDSTADKKVVGLNEENVEIYELCAEQASEARIPYTMERRACPMCPKAKGGAQTFGKFEFRGEADLFSAQDLARALGGQNPHQYVFPPGRAGDNLCLLPGVHVGRGRRVRRWKGLLDSPGFNVAQGAPLVVWGVCQKPVSRCKWCPEETQRCQRWPGVCPKSRQ